MSASAYSLRAQAVDTVLRIKRPDVPLPVGLRNTLAVVLPLAAGLASGHLQAGLGVAAGALNTMFSDQPGPYRQRLRNSLLSTAAAGLAALLGFLIGDMWLPMLLAVAAFGFFGGLLVVFGTNTARVGMTSIILLVVTAAMPTDPTQALGGAALIACGGLLLTAFSLAAWPLQRYGPERQALAAVFAELAQLARQTTAQDDDVPALSDSITTLQHTLLGRHRARGRAMEAFTVLLELAERIRLELTAQANDGELTAIAAPWREQAARVLDAVAEALKQGVAPEPATRALAALQAQEQALFERAGLDAATAVRMHALAGELGAAVRNANWAGGRGEVRARSAEILLPEALRGNAGWPTLRANLTPRSVAFRHAVRTAACLVLALGAARLWQLPHGYWLPMTVAIVLRADFAATFKFGLLRVLGTLLGLVLTSALLHLVPHDQWAHLLLLASLCLAFRLLAGAHYGIAVAALTGTVVILLSFEGVPPGDAVLDRTLNTTLGCALALLAYAVWPTWERTRTRGRQAEMLEAYAGYLRALARPDEPAGTRREARTAARTARSNAQASIERMRGEPVTAPGVLPLAEALFANGNRLARSAMTLEAVFSDFATLPDEAGTCQFVDTLADTVQQVAAAVRGQHGIDAPPELRARQRELGRLLPQACTDAAACEAWLRISDRLVDNVDTLIHVVNRHQQELTAAAPVTAAPA